MPIALRRLVVVLLLVAPWSLLATRHAGAAPIAAGGTAVVATTEGDVLALRAGPGIGYAALAAFAAGTELPVLAGPVPGEDGRLWYQVAGAGLVGWSAARAGRTPGGGVRRGGDARPRAAGRRVRDRDAPHPARRASGGAVHRADAQTPGGGGSWARNSENHPRAS